MKSKAGIILAALYASSMVLIILCFLIKGISDHNLFLGILAALVLAVTCIVISIIDILRNPGSGDFEKVIWILLIIFLYVIGEPLYLITAHRRSDVPKT